MRSAELERLEWKDVDLTARHIVVAASKSEDGQPQNRAGVQMRWPNGCELYSGRQGRVWTGTHYEFYDAQQAVAAATAVEADEAKGVKAQKPVTWKPTP